MFNVLTRLLAGWQPAVALLRLLIFRTSQLSNCFLPSGLFRVQNSTLGPRRKRTFSSGCFENHFLCSADLETNEEQTGISQISRLLCSEQLKPIVWDQHWMPRKQMSALGNPIVMMQELPSPRDVLLSWNSTVNDSSTWFIVSLSDKGKGTI